MTILPIIALSRCKVLRKFFQCREHLLFLIRATCQVRVLAQPHHIVFLAQAAVWIYERLENDGALGAQEVQKIDFNLCRCVHRMKLP